MSNSNGYKIPRNFKFQMGIIDYFFKLNINWFFSQHNMIKSSGLEKDKKQEIK